MKNIIPLSKSIFLYLVFLSFSCSLAINVGAQTPVLFGTTVYGGSYGNGTIFRYDLYNGVEQVVHSFNDTDGVVPQGALVYDSLSGLFYGLTESGGLYNDGTVYSFNPVNDSLKVLWNLRTEGEGIGCEAELVYFAVNGLYYGTTYWGGASGGTIFTFNPANDSVNTVWNPIYYGLQGLTGDLLYDTATQLFYATTQGFPYTSGTLFSFDPVDSIENTVWNFGNGKDGIWPVKNLAFGPDGHLLYGTTRLGGDSDVGTIFRFDPATDSETVVWNFGSGTDGVMPASGMVYNYADGLFYGVTEGNADNGFAGNTIFSFNPTNGSEKVVWNFGAPHDGFDPEAAMVYDPANHLYYGTTYRGGADTGGVIYSFNPSGNIENVLYSFERSFNDGSFPLSPLILYTGISAGVTTVKSTPAIRVYPNPSEGVYTLSGLNAGQVIEVDNCLGQKIASFTAVQPVQQLNIGYVPNGIYLIRILATDATPVYETKVVKN